MILKIKISLFFLFLCNSLIAQEALRDSFFILKKLEGIEIDDLPTDSIHSQLEEAYLLSKKIKFKNGLSRSLMKLGVHHFENNQPSLSLRYFTEAINFFEKEKNKKKELIF